MLSRILIYFKNVENCSYLAKYGKFLKGKYNCKVDGIYVKDIRDYDIAIPTIESSVVDANIGYSFSEIENIEKNKINSIQKIFFEEGLDEFICEDGVSVDVVNNFLKGYDLLIVQKGNIINDDIKGLLKNQYKPIIILPNMQCDVLEKVLFANDGNILANRSISNFIALFNDIKYITMITVNDIEDEKTIKLIKSKGININLCCEKSDDEIKKLLAESLKYDIVVMGNLKHFFIFEKLIGKTGINLLEKINKPIFIG